MTKRFEFDSENNVYVYSIERLIKLCQCDNNHDLAYNHIKQGHIERWLFEIGENELSDIVNKYRRCLSRNGQNNNGQQDSHQYSVSNLCNELSKKINNRKFLDLLDINRAIDTTLKEYEALRAEILQNQVEVSQLILLGLAAIFTIASIGLAPLAGFLTVEDTIIDMPLTLEDVGNIITAEGDQAQDQAQDSAIIKDGDFKIFNDKNIEIKNIEEEIEFSKLSEQTRNNIQQRLRDQDLENSKLIIVGQSSESKSFLRISKTTNGKTIEERGIVPSIVIFNWLIPGLSLYLIYRSLFAIKKNKFMGRYISQRVEQKLVNLSMLRKQYLGIEDNEIEFKYIDPDNNNSDDNHFFTTRGNQTINYIQGNSGQTQGRQDSEYAANFKEHLTHISWENYIAEETTKYSDPLDINLIYIFFSLISGISFVGGSALLMFNFDNNKWFWDDISRKIESLECGLLIGIIVVVICLTWIFPDLVFKTFNEMTRNENNRAKPNLLLISLKVVLNIGCIMITWYFFKEILVVEENWKNSKDISKFLFLLLLPFIVYIVLMSICLQRKYKFEKDIEPKSKREFRTESLDPILDKMWNDRNPNP